jgi:hypothetical protein
LSSKSGVASGADEEASRVANLTPGQEHKCLFESVRCRIAIASDPQRNRIQPRRMAVVEVSQSLAVGHGWEFSRRTLPAWLRLTISPMNWLIKNFLRGLVIVVPIALTLYLLYEAFVRIDRLLNLRWPGAGFAITIAAIIAIGAVASNFFVR